MLVSHKYRFIFIKTTKTAGTSIEVDLGRLLGKDDIATPIFPPVEGHVARNHEVTGLVNRLLRRQIYNHMSAEEVRRIFGKAIFDSYFKFCVEREPVDKCISQYSMWKNSPVHGNQTGIADMSWENYLRLGRFPIDTPKYTDRHGNLLVDRILRYETLNEDLGQVASELGLPFTTLKAKAKTGLRSDLAVTPAQRELIYTAFSDSLKFTGYRL